MMRMKSSYFVLRICDAGYPITMGTIIKDNEALREYISSIMQYDSAIKTNTELRKREDEGNYVLEIITTGTNCISEKRKSCIKT